MSFSSTAVRGAKNPVIEFNGTQREAFRKQEKPGLTGRAGLPMTGYLRGMTIAADASLLSVSGPAPQVHETAFVASGARLVGDVRIGEGASVWYNAVVRGDSAAITLGAGSNLQDNVSVHVDVDSPVVIGENVSVGHNAVVHGCTIGDGSLIGMGSVVLSGVVIGAGCLIAGGAVVLEGSVIPDGSLVAGVPAKVRRQLSDDERAGILRNAQIYRTHSANHAAAAPA